MFGHQDDQNEHHHHEDDHKPMEDVLSAPAVDGVLGGDDHPGTVVSSDNFNPALPANDNDQPAVAQPAEPVDYTTAEPVADQPVVTDQPVAPVSDDLLGIKQQALTELSPLVGHLEQTPEEKFRTTMMMIQASDNKDLIKVAYESAQAITDEKVKAQALLDIVNEINYFTQNAA